MTKRTEGEREGEQFSCLLGGRLKEFLFVLRFLFLD